MSSHIRRTVSLLLLALIAVLAIAACGGGGSDSAEVPDGAIAVVGDKTVTKEEFDALIEQQKKSAESQKQDFPEVGTPEYEALKATVVKGLVEQKEWELEGEAMGIKVTDEEIETELDKLKQQFFNGDQQKYEAELAKQSLTDAQVRDELRTRVLTNKIYEAVTKNVTVTDTDIKAYYDKNPSQYQQPASREVRHILVKSKAKAQEHHDQIQSGADFAKLAKKYTQDEASKADGGKFTAFKGRTVEPFDKFVFSAKTGELSDPIKTEFGWHIIEVLSAIKPATTTPLDQVKDSIKTTVLQTKQNAAMKAWIANLQSKYADDISYAPGYAPASTGTDTGGAATTVG
jgi:parvulin-like peptidyl-prolyl isomerase